MRVEGLRFIGLRVEGLGWRVEGLGLRVEGLGVEGLGLMNLLNNSVRVLGLGVPLCGRGLGIVYAMITV